MEREQLQGLLTRLTLDEKLGMIHGNELFRTKGVERLNIPPFTTSDGPMGVRKDYEKTKWFDIGTSGDQTSYLLSNTAVAATWNPDIAYESGKILGKEARGRGKDMILAPGINLQRTPLCGRNFEYMGEDPYLVSEMVVPMVKGIEENDVSSCVKHFALNNQETNRLAVDVNVDERALRELYLPGFKAAVQKGNAKAIMGAYNKWNGTHCCHNNELLNGILRDDWGFDGVVVSDWGGTHDTMEAAMNGLDMEMSVTDNFDEYYMANPLKKLVLDGVVPEAVVDEKVLRILNLMNELHMLDGDRYQGSYNDIEDKVKMLEAARESVVLLKNENHRLPLTVKKGMNILVVGDNANRCQAPGGGSAEIKALYEVTPLLGITMLAGGDVNVTFKKGYDAFTTGNIWDDSHKEKEESWQATSLESQASREDYMESLTPEQEAANKLLADEAVEAAKQADLVIYVGGLNHEQDTEGRDRKDMKLPYEQDSLIERLLEVCPDMVVVMVSGSPVDMRAFKDKASAIVQSWYAGMEGGRALAEVLFGKVNPSGKLPETFPLCIEDTPAYVYGEFPGDDSVTYHEGIYVGYRYYSTKGIPVAYPFGYGISYTDYEYSDLRIENVSSQDEVNVKAYITVKNTGKMAGKETVQLYVHALDSKVERPVRELRAFAKVALNPGESKTVELTLNEEAFTYFDVEKDCFFAEKGSYEIQIGANVEDIRLKEAVVLEWDYTVMK